MRKSCLLHILKGFCVVIEFLMRNLGLSQASSFLCNSQYKLSACHQICGGFSNRIASNNNSEELPYENEVVIDAIIPDLEFIVHPNPSANEYNFTFSSGTDELSFEQLFNSEDKEVYHHDNLAPNERITFGSDFAKGIYQVKITPVSITKTSRKN